MGVGVGGFLVWDGLGAVLGSWVPDRQKGGGVDGGCLEDAGGMGVREWEWDGFGGGYVGSGYVAGWLSSWGFTPDRELAAA